MLKGLYTAYTGMIQEQKRMDTLANNLANADTTGFKKEGLTSQSFDTVLVDKIRDDSDPYRYARRIGPANPGVKIGESYTDFTQGSLQVTDVSMDFALGGPGFFTVDYAFLLIALFSTSLFGRHPSGECLNNLFILVNQSFFIFFCF